MTAPLIVAALMAATVGWVVWRFVRMPKRVCIYPHCSVSRAGCAHTCPHWQQDNYGGCDEHADDKNFGI